MDDACRRYVASRNRHKTTDEDDHDGKQQDKVASGAALSASLLWATSAPIKAQEARIGHDPRVLISTLTTPAIARLTVSSAQVTKGALSVDATQYGANLFPGLTWSAAQI